ncbi:MAG: N-acyl homoserine lactonase family protein [Beutenbergiaceae bacterium]
MSPWSVWVLEYAVAEEFPMSLAVYGAHNQGTRRAPFSYVVAKRGSQVVLIDIGFGSTVQQRAIAEDSAVTDWRDPGTVLGQIGLRPEDVTHVVVTHAHYDHFGNSSAFPKAQFFMSAREVQFWVSELALPPELRTFVSPIDPADIVAAVDLAARGRLQLLSGAAEALFPGFDVLPAWDTHTPGSIYVRIDTVDGPLVLAGDNVYSWDNVEGLDADGIYRPVGLVVGSNIAATKILAEMMRYADGRPRRIIPVHEDRLRLEYPSRQAENGAMIVEVTLAPGQASCLPG